MGAKYEAYIESEADGLDISVLAVVPDETPYRGILQLVHGMSEYKERYLPFMEYMAKKGYVCVIHDHRGHGKSVRRWMTWDICMAAARMRSSRILRW